METNNTEQEFIKKAVTLAKDRNLSADNITELLEELNIGETKE